MAIFHSHIFDNASGSVGNITLCKRGEKTSPREKSASGAKSKPRPSALQQKRFKALSDLSFDFAEAIQAGSPERSWSAARALFFKLNQNAVEVDEETLAVTIQPERITCTTGNLLPPAVNVSIRAGERIIRVARERQPLSPVAKDEDELFLVIHDPRKRDTATYPLGRGTPGTGEFPLHEGFAADRCIAYVFALSTANHRASVFKHTGIALE